MNNRSVTRDPGNTRNRNVKEETVRNNNKLSRGCKVAGCMNRAAPMSYCCPQHEADSDAYRATNARGGVPQYPQTHATVGQTRFVSYGEKPENGKNKL